MNVPDYLEFIGNRPCTLCGDPRGSYPFQPLRSLRGISQAGLAQKGAIYLAIPMCLLHQSETEHGKGSLNRELILEIIVTNLICYLDSKREQLRHISAKSSTGGRPVAAKQ